MLFRSARGGEENGGFGSRSGRTGITNVGGEEFSIDTRGLGGRVVVNFRRSYVWRHEIIIYVGIGRSSRRRRRRAGKRGRAGSRASDEELDEDTGEESGKDVNQRELALPGRVLDLLRGEQGFVLILIGSEVAFGAWLRLDVLGIFGVHTSSSRLNTTKRCCRPITWVTPFYPPSWLVSGKLLSTVGIFQADGSSGRFYRVGCDNWVNEKDTISSDTPLIDVFRFLELMGLNPTSSSEEGVPLNDSIPGSSYIGEVC